MKLTDDIKTIKPNVPFKFTYIDRNGVKKAREHLFNVHGERIFQVPSIDITDLTEDEFEAVSTAFSEYLEYLDRTRVMSFNDFCDQIGSTCNGVPTSEKVKFRTIRLDRIESCQPE